MVVTSDIIAGKSFLVPSTTNLVIAGAKLAISPTHLMRSLSKVTSNTSLLELTASNPNVQSDNIVENNGFSFAISARADARDIG